MTTILRLTGIQKHYGNAVALEDVDLQIEEGEVVGLVGDNGAGKSTLVKIISGAIQPDAGTIEFDGADRSWTSPHDSLAAGIETLYQDGGLAPHLTVSANVFLGRELRYPGILGRLGLLNNREMKRRAMSELARVGITSIRNDVGVTALSGGQRQAVAIGRTVAWARKLILLDEPTNHLSVMAAEEVLNIISEVRKHGVSVILISHSLPHAMRATDRVVSLRIGRVVSDRPTKTLTVDDIIRDITGVTSSAA